MIWKAAVNEHYFIYAAKTIYTNNLNCLLGQILHWSEFHVRFSPDIFLVINIVFFLFVFFKTYCTAKQWIGERLNKIMYYGRRVVVVAHETEKTKTHRRS